MNEKTEQLLEKLAEKLGTTSEYLWQILLNQAKYDAITSFIQMAFMAGFIYATIKIHLWLMKELPKPADSDRWYSKRTGYDKYEEPAIVGMVLAGITSIILLLFFLSGFNELIAAVFNPEYWALNRILNAL